MSRPTIRKGPASSYAGPGESIYEFSDRQSGGLISLRRPAEGPNAGRLVVEVYNTDDDVVVLGPPRVERPQHLSIPSSKDPE